MFKPDPKALWRSYEALKPHEKSVLELKALIGDAVTKGIFFQLLQPCGLLGPEGKAWTSATLNPLLDTMVKKGLLDQTFACAPVLAHRLARQAAERESDAKLRKGLQRALPRSQRDLVPRGHYSYRPLAHDRDLFRCLRVAIYTNNTGEFIQLVMFFLTELNGTRILRNYLRSLPSDIEWLESRQPPIQTMLAVNRLEGLLDEGIVQSDQTAAIAILSREETPIQPIQKGGVSKGGAPEGGSSEVAPDGVSLLLVRHAILAGAFDAALDRAKALGRESPLLSAAQAAIAFLKGDNSIALAGFREALKQSRKRAKKRKTVLEAEFGVLHVLALLQAHDVTLHSEIRTLLDAGLAGDEFWSPAYIALEGLLHLASGQESPARISRAKISRLAPDQPFVKALVSVAELALDSDTARHNEPRNKRDYQQIENSLPLVGLIHAQVLSRTGPHNERWRDICLEQKDSGIIDFTEIVALKPLWERAFETLNMLLVPETQKNPQTPNQNIKRLVFLVDPESKHIEPLEQIVKKGEWSAGRTIALKRLHELDPRLDYLTDHDRRVLRCLHKYNLWYNQSNYQFDSYTALLALIGHPHVFDAREPTRRVELIAYPIELVVKETSTGYAFDLSHHAEEPTIFIEAETAARWRVIEYNRKLATLKETLGTNGLAVPREAKEKVIGLLRAKSPLLPIRSELADVEVETIEGISTPVIQLARAGEGLRVLLAVRPLGAEGPFYVPGQGGRSVLVFFEGQNQRVVRDLAAETAAAARFIEHNRSLAPWRAGEYEWMIGDLAAALEFLVEARAASQDIQFEWPDGEALKITRPVTASNLTFKVSQAKDWFEVRGNLAVDEDLVLDMEEVLARLDKAQGRFVPLADGSFIALTEDLQRQLGRLQAVSEETPHGRRFHKFGSIAVEDMIEAAGKVDADKHWRAHIAKIKAARLHEPQLPSTLQAELRAYQIEGFVWMSRLAHLGMGACLADDMGLGKTVQTIAVLLERQTKGPSLIVAPTSVCHNWEQEILRFAPTLEVHRLGASSDRKALIESLVAGDVLLIGYGLLYQVEEALASRSWNCVVFDEAQNLKNATTRRAKASRAIEAEFRVALSGTPIENYLEELWSLFNTINPGLLGSREGFQKRFVTPVERGPKQAAREALRALIRPFILRRTKAAVLAELPPRTEVTIEVELSDKERAFYEALRRQSIERLAALKEREKSGQRKIHILAEIMRLRRACCHPGLIDPSNRLESAKLAAFLEIADELIRNRHKALVFSQFIGHLEKVKEALDALGIAYHYLDGSVPENLRAQRVEAFQRGEGDLFLISLKAGGAGLNLTAADYVIHLDPWWNPVEDQASDRAHRIGQSRPVTIYRLIVQDSIEERILDLHARKRDLAAEVLDGADVAARLNEDELLALISG